jgi:hypothetical protein
LPGPKSYDDKKLQSENIDETLITCLPLIRRIFFLNRLNPKKPGMVEASPEDGVNDVYNRL